MEGYNAKDGIYRLIGTVTFINDQTNVADANARLIVAAPELLEACKQLS